MKTASQKGTSKAEWWSCVKVSWWCREAVAPSPEESEWEAEGMHELDSMAALIL